MKEPSKNFKIWFLISIFVLGTFALYQIFLKNPVSEPNLLTGEEKEEQSIWDIFSGGLEVNDIAPDFVSEDVYGNKISLSEFQNKKPVLLVFWATWCGYCAKELPDLKTFTDIYQNEIQVIAVTSGENKKTVKEYIQKENVNFLIVLDEKREIWNQYFIRGTPSHFLITASGMIASLRPGLSSKENLEIMLTMLR